MIDPSPIYPEVKASGEYRHLKYLSYLSEIAAEIMPVGAARIAAAIVYKNNIVSIGINQKKTHPFQAKFCRNQESIYLHAENDAINKAAKILSQDQLSRSVIYISRMKFVDNSKRLMTTGLCKPCNGCYDSIKHHGISKVVYTLDDKGYNHEYY